MLEEAGNMIRRVPSLLALPLLLLASLAVVFGLFFMAFVGLATASNEQLQGQMEHLSLKGMDIEGFRKMCAAALALVFLCPEPVSDIV